MPPPIRGAGDPHEGAGQPSFSLREGGAKIDKSRPAAQEAAGSGVPSTRSTRSRRRALKCGVIPSAIRLASRVTLGSLLLLAQLLSHLLADFFESQFVPSGRLLAEVRQDFAGVGGDVRFFRTTADL